MSILTVGPLSDKCSSEGVGGKRWGSWLGYKYARRNESSKNKYPEDHCKDDLPCLSQTGQQKANQLTNQPTNRPMCPGFFLLSTATHPSPVYIVARDFQTFNEIRVYNHSFGQEQPSLARARRWKIMKNLGEKHNFSNKSCSSWAERRKISSRHLPVNAKLNQRAPTSQHPEEISSLVPRNLR